MSLAKATLRLTSFDGGFSSVADVYRPNRYRHLDGLPGGLVRSVRGGGYSYVAASFGAGGAVVDASAFDRLLSFDPGTGVLVCEAGASLGKIYAAAAARGFFLPVQPGYPHITVGGCIAADVHGKNPARDGTFRCQVRGLTLHHPRHGVLNLEPGPPGGAFDLTCGGFGLTGQILTATLQLARLPAGSMLVRRRPVARLEEAPDLLAEWSPHSDVIYTWHNLATGSRDFGRGLLYTGNFVAGTESAPPRRMGPGPPDRLGTQRAPRSVPFFGPMTARLFNRAFEWQQRTSSAERVLSLFQALFPVTRRMVYFRLFGRRGFHEYQLLLPRPAFPEFARRVRRALSCGDVPITLCSCKLFGGVPGLLRFDGDGVCVALDFTRCFAATAFATFLDDLARDLGGRPNLLKDSRLPRGVVQTCIPEYAGFVSALARFDPERRFRSELSERLGL